MRRRLDARATLRFLCSQLCAVALLVLPGRDSPAAAQTVESGKWAIEVHAGGVFATNPATGTTSMPAPGPVFQTPVGRSRRISSWYFGDGTMLFNQVAAALVLSQRITALDAVLRRPLAERRPGGSLGARVTRELTPRLGVELSIDYSLAPLQITRANADAIEATRASFTAAFTGILTPTITDPGLGLRGLTVTSTTGLDHGDAHQLLTSAVVKINLKTTGSVIPFATVGLGVLSTTGTTPSATLTGNYRVSPLAQGLSPLLNETDDVTLTEVRKDHSAAGVLGGGVQVHVSPRWGVRVDTRVHLTRNTASTTLDASPDDVTNRAPGIFSLRPLTDPTLVFGGTITSFGTPVVASTLTGPAIADFRTFSGRGTSSQTTVSAGVFWKF